MALTDAWHRTVHIFLDDNQDIEKRPTQGTWVTLATPDSKRGGEPGDNVRV
jgi:hypothetical protein